MARVRHVVEWRCRCAFSWSHENARLPVSASRCARQGQRGSGSTKPPAPSYAVKFGPRHGFRNPPAPPPSLAVFNVGQRDDEGRVFLVLSPGNVASDTTQEKHKQSDDQPHFHEWKKTFFRVFIDGVLARFQDVNGKKQQDEHEKLEKV